MLIFAKHLWVIVPKTFNNFPLYVKIVGRQILVHHFRGCIKLIIKTQSPFQVIELGNGHFVLNFSTLEDMNFALSEGPWTIFEYYIAL